MSEAPKELCWSYAWLIPGFIALIPWHVNHKTTGVRCKEGVKGFKTPLVLTDIEAPFLLMVRGEMWAWGRHGHDTSRALSSASYTFLNVRLWSLFTWKRVSVYWVCILRGEIRCFERDYTPLTCFTGARPITRSHTHSFIKFSCFCPETNDHEGNTLEHSVKLGLIS